MDDRTRVWDVIVAGAGIAGAAAALGLKRALGPTGRVLLCDPTLSQAPNEARPASFRAVAIAPDVRRDLESLGVWTGVAARAQPVTGMVITDARPGLLPNPAFLTFGEADAGPEPLAHMVFSDDLRRTLVESCAVAGVRFETGAAAGMRVEAWGLDLLLSDGSRHRTRLLAAADGGRSRLRHAARIQTLDIDYPQAAVTATLSHPIDHGGQAIQHFFPAGPIALLPLRADDWTRRRTSLVWTESIAEAARLVALPPASFCVALEERIGLNLGPLTLEDRPQAHTLKLRLARQLTAPRFALLGEAARVIHPLAGQGLNLGLRDAAALTHHVKSAASLGLDPGSPRTLAAYERERRPNAALMAAGTDLLDRLFSSDGVALRALRDIGLGTVDRWPALKQSFAGRAGATPSRMR